MNRKNKKLLSLFLTISFLVPLSGGSNFVKADSLRKDNLKAHSLLSEKLSPKLKEKLKNKDAFNDNAPLKHTDPSEKVRVIVQMKDSPLLKEKTRSKKGIKALLDSEKKEMSKLKKQQDSVISKAQSLTGGKIRNRYEVTANGFSMEVKRGDIEKLKAIKGVKSVKEATKYKVDLAYAKALTGVYNAWESYGYKGQGTVVAVIDSGIDVSHKDMRLSDTTMPKLNEGNVLIDGDPGKYYTKKVPYAYNFADKNNDIIDTNPETGMHGMHVAGIVGANGIESEVEKLKAVQGVAPEAQILALKVFTNNPDNKYAYSDDIAAAIDSAVMHQADVINMSLGSVAGFQDPDDIEQIAIQNAADNGVVVVCSAGNEAYSTYTSKYANVVDTGLIGSPGIAAGALSVASYENSKVTANLLQYSGTKNGKIPYLASASDPVGLLSGQVDVVDCNFGEAADFNGKDVHGKIALIKRGKNTFVEKQINAQNAGAVCVIVYNADGKEDFVKMAGDSSITIPAIFIRNSDGSILKNIISSGLKVSFNGELTGVDNVNKDDMSDFTSWGPAPNLAFKPEIAAPGGQIYSTVNNNSYESMSGTSMASPHVAGAEALLVQAIKEKNLGLDGIDLINFVKAASMNTSVPKLDKNGVPYSPRRQGAGLIQINDAIKNNVTVTDENGSAAIALKEIGQKTTVKLTVTNYGDKDAVYTLGGSSVLTEVKEAEGMSYDMPISNAKISFDPENTITVQKHSSKDLYVNINLPNEFEKQQFVEGFIKLQSNSNSTPSLNVPYMGFYGNWSNMDIIDLPMWDNNTVYGTSTVATKINGDLSYLGMKNGSVYPNLIAISPNDDGYSDIAIPYLVFLRNAKTMNITIQNEKGEIVRSIGKDSFISKDVINEQNGSVGRYDDKWTWDGKVKNPDNGLLEVKEGQYFIVVKSKIDYENAEMQEFQMPVKVDVTAPEIKMVSSDVSHSSKYILKWNASDTGSGIGANGIALNGTLIKDAVINDLGNGEYSCELNLHEGKNNIEILSLDNANNESSISTAVTFEPFNIKFDNLSENMRVNTRNLTVTGKLNYLVQNLMINGVNAVINKDLSFSAKITLKDVTNDVTVKAVDFDGSSLFDKSIRVYSDITPPVISFISPRVDGDGKVYTNKDSIMVKGTVYDDTFGYNFYINEKLEKSINLPYIGGEKGTKQEFSTEVPVTNGCKVSVKAVDTVGNETPVTTFDVVVDKDSPVITIKNVDNEKFYNHDILPEITVNEGIITEATLNGKKYDLNKEVISAEGTYKLVVKAVDKAGNEAVKEVNFVIDKTVPVITIKNVENGKYYNSDVTPIITASEGTLTMTLNGKEYKGEAITKEGQYELKAAAVDSALNKTEVTVKFTIDKTKPQISVKGVEDGKYYNTDITPVITTSEGTLTMTLNGKEYKGEAITKEGQYELKAAAVDSALNKTEVTIKFTIDKTKPEISVKKVEDGKYYNTDVTPAITASEGTLTMTLNGKEYKGETIKDEGNYELIVVALDSAGNKTVVKLTFTIDKTSPVITVSGVEDGKAYKTSVLPSVKSSEGDLQMTLDGNKYNGEEIKAIGSHELSITSVDKAGNTTKKLIKFSIEKENSPIVKTGYFFDLKLCILIGSLFMVLGAFMVLRKRTVKR